MSVRRVARAGLVIVLVAGCVAAAVRWWARPRVVEAGSAVVAVEGRELGLGTESMAGVGVSGTLGLVRERCVGFVAPGQEGSIIVWPAGTEVSGVDESVVISSEGRTYRLGDQVDFGTADVELDVRGFRSRLPAPCADTPLLKVWPAG